MLRRQITVSPEMVEVQEALIKGVARAWADNRGFSLSEQDIADLADFFLGKMSRSQYMNRIKNSPGFSEKIRCGYEELPIQ